MDYKEMVARVTPFFELAVNVDSNAMFDDDAESANDYLADLTAIFEYGDHYLAVSVEAYVTIDPVTRRISITQHDTYSADCWHLYAKNIDDLAGIDGSYWRDLGENEAAALEDLVALIDFDAAEKSGFNYYFT